MSDSIYLTIPLTQGQVTIIDNIDADLADLKWHTYPCGDSYHNKSFWAQRNIYRPDGKRTTDRLHRFILSRILNRPLIKGEFVDHINGNTLDNRRSNLRLASRSQNSANAGKYTNNTSGYKGVSWHKRSKHWYASIRKNGKSIHLGQFDTPEAAHVAYCKAAEEFHGEFARFE